MAAPRVPWFQGKSRCNFRGVVTTVALFAILLGACGGDDRQESRSTKTQPQDPGTLTTVPFDPSGPIPTLPPPGEGTKGKRKGPTAPMQLPDLSPTDAAETAAWEAQAASTGATRDFGQVFAYDLTAYLTATRKRELSGTAEFMRTPTLASLTVIPDGGDPLTLYLEPTSTELFWCNQEACYSVRVKAHPGEGKPGSPYEVAALLIANLDPGSLLRALRDPARAEGWLATTSRVVGSQTVQCSKMAAYTTASKPTTAERCWTPDGRIVLFETGSQSVRETKTIAARPVNLPLALDDNPRGARPQIDPSKVFKGGAPPSTTTSSTTPGPTLPGGIPAVTPTTVSR